ncbi:Gfo/Idh/MocA family protein [Brachybacterium sp. FME24]|uniref:Gfo/Idh/MocA family protein n=1 Tax=Brachybacterium sp. FME24 TaxID=2742605 RepID=UPI001866B086|nr:Gfo/Idh/MocA family oxidoreductase [Brachybacterium sp. FME24]
MSHSLRIAVLGAWHVHARDYGRALRAHPEVEVIGIWDEDSARGRQLAEQLGIEFVASRDHLLGRSDLDGVVVTTATRDHDEVIAAALSAGRHVFTEKLLSPTVAGCDALIALADQHDRVLTVSLPRLALGCVAALRDLLDSGALGTVVTSRVRLAHGGGLTDQLPEWFYDPQEALGGAFTDLGAHPACLTQVILGDEFESVHAAYAHVTGRAVEDSAVVTVTTAGGAIGVIETGFVTPSGPLSFEVHGTEGSVLYGTDPGGAPRLRLRTADGWSEIEIPDNGPAPLQQWAEAIRRRERTTDNLARARALTSLVVAANDSAR